MNTRILVYLTLLLSYIPFSSVYGSHMAGGNITYSYLGDTLISGNTFMKCEITLYLYQDCEVGVPDAIVQDNPAFLTLYDNSGNVVYTGDSVVYFDPAPGTGGSEVIENSTLLSECGGISIPQVCLLRKKFIKTWYIPVNDKSYTIVYQRCCRLSSLINISNSEETGVTFFCTIPAGNSNIRNTGAVFGEYPPQTLCRGYSVTINQSATDADGDSLTYELSPCYNGANGADIKPQVASAPPYDALQYTPGYSFTEPMHATAHMSIDVQSGNLTVTPDKVGRYQVAIACREWRNGVNINTVFREFQFTVKDCNEFGNTLYKPDAGQNQTVLAGDTLRLKGAGAVSYSWSPSQFLDNPMSAQPLGTFTDPGKYYYVLQGISDSGCVATDTVLIQVLAHSTFAVPNAFTPDGDGINDKLIPIALEGALIKSFSVYNKWGELVYSNLSKSIVAVPQSSQIAWDGTFNGVRQPQGVYVWKIEYTDSNGIPRLQVGNVTLFH